MAFLPALSGWQRRPSGPSARLHIARSGRALDRRRLTFALSRELIEMAGWQAGERFVVSIGVGEDLGAFQIARVTRPRTGIKLIAFSRASGFRLHLSLPPEIHGLSPANLFDGLPSTLQLDFTVADQALTVSARAAIALHARAATTARAPLSTTIGTA